MSENEQENMQENYYCDGNLSHNWSVLQYLSMVMSLHILFSLSFTTWAIIEVYYNILSLVMSLHTFFSLSYTTWAIIEVCYNILSLVMSLHTFFSLSSI